MQLTLIEKEYNISFSSIHVDSVKTKENWNEFGLSDGEKCVYIYTTKIEMDKIFDTKNFSKNLKEDTIKNIFPKEYLNSKYANEVVLFTEKEREDNGFSKLVFDINNGIIYYYLLLQ